MKKRSPVALLGAGKLVDSPLSRLPGLAQWLGPVAAPSFRVASRISNTLRGGHPVHDYSEFDDCPLLLVSIPDSMTAKMVRDLARAPIGWQNKCVVLCSDVLGDLALGPIAAQGAAIGSLGSIAGFEDWFLVEGGNAVNRQLRPILSHLGIKVTLIDEGRKEDYIAAIDAFGASFTPRLKQAAESLKEAGLSHSDSLAILEKQMSRTARSYFRSGKL